jgi:hypothetical protein
MADLTELAELVKGLLTLEINTVQKDGMTALKMPNPQNALVELVQTYWEFLCQRSHDFGDVSSPLPSWADKLSKSFYWGCEPFPQPPGGKRPLIHPEGEPPPGGYDPDFLVTSNAPDRVSSFELDRLREIAVWMLEMQLRTEAVTDAQSLLHTRERAELTAEELSAARIARKRFRAEERSIFQRIRRNCDQLKPIVSDRTITRSKIWNAANPADVVDPATAFDPKCLVIIRKAWDIGVEIVLMQTVIQIDGDVVNRIQTGMDGPEKAELHALHARAVDISLRSWGTLVDTVGKIASGTFRALLGKI